MGSYLLPLRRIIGPFLCPGPASKTPGGFVARNSQEVETA